MALEPLAPPPAPRLVTSNDDLTSLQMKVSMLEDRLNLIQDMSNHDSTRWESKHGTNFEVEIRNIFNQNEPDKTRNLVMSNMLLYFD
jgi:hypothetical protein